MRKIFPDWFDHLEESFLKKKLKKVLLASKNQWPPAVNINETPTYLGIILCTMYWIILTKN